MKFALLCICSWVVAFTIAQPSYTCVFTSSKTGSSQKIKFTEAYSATDSLVFKTDYYLFDNNNLPFKAITAANNTQLKTVTITLRELKTGTLEETYIAPYNQFSGLVINEQGDSVTQLAKSYYYLYLFSFTSAEKKQVKLHFASVLDEYTILLSTLTDSVLSANRDYLKQSAYYKQFLAEKQRREAERIAREKEIDSLVNIKFEALRLQQKASEPAIKPASQSTTYPAKETGSGTMHDVVIQAAQAYKERYTNDSVEIIKTNDGIQSKLKKLAFNPSEGRYDVDKDGSIFYGNNAQGREGDGLLVKENRMIYSGIFTKGQFVSGQVYLKYKNGKVYIGNFAYAQPKGLGKWSLPSGEMELGIFDGNMLQSGVVRKIDSLQGSYSGSVANGRKNGFGIFITTKGNTYVGIYKDDILEQGYVLQTDDVGLKSYFTVINGEKRVIPEKEWMDNTRILLSF